MLLDASSSTFFKLALSFAVEAERDRALRLLAHALDGVEHVLLLREEGVAEVGRPLDVVRETFHHLGQR